LPLVPARKFAVDALEPAVRFLDVFAPDAHLSPGIRSCRIPKIQCSVSLGLWIWNW
jgi:hypothetical protein